MAVISKMEVLVAKHFKANALHGVNELRLVLWRLLVGTRKVFSVLSFNFCDTDSEEQDDTVCICIVCIF